MSIAYPGRVLSKGLELLVQLHQLTHPREFLSSLTFANLKSWIWTLFYLTYTYTLYTHSHAYILIHMHTLWYFLFIRNIWGGYWLHCQLWNMQLPLCHFMTILVNIITITAESNLFSWLQIHETNCCDATVWSKQEQAAQQPNFPQLLQLKSSSSEGKSKSLPHLWVPTSAAMQALHRDVTDMGGWENYRAGLW